MISHALMLILSLLEFCHILTSRHDKFHDYASKLLLFLVIISSYIKSNVMWTFIALNLHH